jgi:hypothetical protein
VTHLPANFGADAVSASNLHGAGILATDLRVAVDSMSSQDQALIKLRRGGGKDISIIAHF